MAFTWFALIVALLALVLAIICLIGTHVTAKDEVRQAFLWCVIVCEVVSAVAQIAMIAAGIPFS